MAQDVDITVPNTNPASFPVGTASFTATATATASFLGASTVTFRLLSGATILSTSAADNSSPYSQTIPTSTLTVGTYTLRATNVYTGLFPGTLSDEITINITPTTPTAPATSTCINTTATINVSGSSPAGGVYSLYSAPTGGTALSTTTGSTLTTPVITATTTYYVSYTVSGQESARQSVSVTANTPPAAPVITAPATVATGVNATVSAPATAGITYTWNTNGGTPASATGNSISVQWASGGVKTITCTATNANGCSTSSTKTIVVNQAMVTANYAFSHPITLNTNLMGITSTLNNFPALVYIKEDALKTSATACANNVKFPTGGANGYDFAFTTNGGTTELFYQVESFDPATGTLLAWVQIPTVTNAATTLNFYFGSLTPNHGIGFDSGTWAGDYLAVYHFNENSTNVLDATTNSRSATGSNTTSATGKITSGYSFNGSTSFIKSNANTNNITGAFTLSAWVYVNTLSSDQKIVTNENSYDNGGYKLGITARTGSTPVLVELETRTNTGGLSLNRSATGGTGVTASAWHYVQGVFDGVNTFTTYYDGAVDRTYTSGGPSGDNGGFIFIGSDFDNSDAHRFNGVMDELRLSSIGKTTDWIKAEYYNQNNQTTFTTSGTNITTNATAAAAIGGSLVYTWTGTSGTSIATATNWTTPASGNPNGAPPTNGTASLVIPNVTNKPALTANAAFYGITIASGSSFNLAGNTLTVGCNIYNNGTINPAGVSNASTLVWNGSFTPQLYTGTNTVNTAQFGSMNISNTASSGQVKISGGPIDLYNTLSLTSGSLNIDNAGSGALTLKSSSSITARVAALPSTSTVTGNVTVERWFTGGAPSNRGWRLMSSPVNNSATVPLTASATYNFSSLKNTMFVTGLGGTGNGFDASANNGPTILLYNTPTFLFSSPATITSTAKVGSGFYFYFRGNRTTNAANKLVRPFATPDANTVGIQTGALNQQGLTYTLSNAGHAWNQVGNPYPSSISMPSGGGSNPAYVGTTGFVYTYVSNANSVTPALAAITISSGQGFFVQSNAASSSINFTESMKTTGQSSPFLLGLPVGTEPPAISLKMVQDSSNYDVTHLRFLDTYKKEFYDMEDAEDLNGQGQAVFFGAMTADNHLVAIASQPLDKQKTSIFLNVNDNTSGLYSIEKMDITGINPVYDVWLMDHFKKDSLDLRANSTYKFNLDKTNPDTYGASRFEVVIRKKSLPPYQLISFNGAQSGADVSLNWNTLNEYDYTSFELQKSTDGINFTTVKTIQSSSLGSYSFKDIYNNTGATDVYYRLKQTDINDNVTYSKIIIISTQGDGATLTIFPNPASSTIQYSLKKEIKLPVRLRIFNAMGVLMKNSTFTALTGQQDISSLTPGNYTIELTELNSKKIILTGKFIKI